MSVVTITQIQSSNWRGVKYEVNVQFSKDKFNYTKKYAYSKFGAKLIAKKVIRQHSKPQFKPKVIEEYEK